MKLADASGLDALSMRSLAKELGFGVMSLYNHIANKEDLVDGMVDLVAGEIELPADGGSAKWKRNLRACAISAYRMLLMHRWASVPWGRKSGPAKNHYHEALLRVMRQADFPEELACRGFHALTMHVVGFASQAIEMPFTNKKEFAALGHKTLSDLSPEEFPFLSEHIEFHLAGRDKRSDFKYMLDLILDGLERDLRSALTNSS